MVIFRYYFQTRGINSFLKNKIIRNRFMLSLMIIVYELPFTMLISRDAIMMIFYGRIDSWTNFTESFVYKEYDSLTIIPRIVYMTQGFFIPLFCLSEPQVKKHLKHEISKLLLRFSPKRDSTKLERKLRI